MNRALTSISSLGFAVVGLASLFAACSSTEDPKGSGGAGGTSATGGASGSAGATGATAGRGAGGAGGVATGGTGGSGVGGAGGVATGGVGGGVGGVGGSVGGAGGLATGGVGGSVGGAGGVPTTGGSSGAGGTDAGGQAGSGTSGSAGSPPMVDLPPLVTSAAGAYWKDDVAPTDSTAAATVTVNDAEAQTWDGFGGAFNELGWDFLTTQALKDEAIKLLFSAAEGANFAWGRIPMGASDYAKPRYTLDDTGTDKDPVPSGEGNRPAADTAELPNFSLTRDEGKLIPYIKAAQGLKPELRFWASPWTPPSWMKTGWKTDNGGNSAEDAVRPSFFDGGNMKSDASILTAYALYFKKFVEGYKAKQINIEIVSPQNEPGYDQNYPSCLWDATTYTTFIRDYLGPAMEPLGIKLMLGTMSNAGDAGRDDTQIATAVLADANAKKYLSVAGAQWGVLGKVVSGTKFGDLPIWATEHKCGNYPWESSYVSGKAPNDQAYAEESWGYIRDAINKGKVTSYNAWNMVLDKDGEGNDESREWKQNALLVVENGAITKTPTYHVFRHFSQYVTPKAKVLTTSSNDAVGFKNPDGSVVAVVFNSGAANPSFVVALGGKKVQFAMPTKGWATVLVKP